MQRYSPIGSDVTHRDLSALQSASQRYDVRNERALSGYRQNARETIKARVISPDMA